MHPLEQHYTGGSDYALASFGLEKIAIMSPAQRPKGLAGIMGAAGDAELARLKPSGPPVKPGIPLPAPGGPASIEQGFEGGPGLAAGFGGGGLPLEAPQMVGAASLKGQQPSRMLPTAMTGRESIPGQAAQAEMRARAVPMRFNLPAKLAAFLLPSA